MLKKLNKILPLWLKLVIEYTAVASIIFIIFYYGEGSYISLIRKGMAEYYYLFKNTFGLKPPQHIYSDLLLIQALSFFTLTFITPRISFMRKLKFLIIGIVVFFAADLFFVFLDLTFQSSETWILLIEDFLKLALPFSLWFIFSYDYLIKFAEDRLEK
jgi:hypothetical protein